MNQGWSGRSTISGSCAVGRHAGEDQPALLQRVAVMGVDLVAVAVALADLGRAVDRRDMAVAGKLRRDRRRAASCRRGRSSAARCCSPSSLIHSVIRPTTGSLVSPNSVVEASAIPAVFRAPSMQAICMPRQMPKNGTSRSRAKRTRGDLALAAALAEPAGDEDAVQRLELGGEVGVVLLEHLGVEPADVDLDPVGDAAVDQRLAQATCRRRAGRHICRPRRSSLRLRDGRRGP